jgi:hypothetical protein
MPGNAKRQCAQAPTNLGDLVVHVYDMFSRGDEEPSVVFTRVANCLRFRLNNHPQLLFKLFS